MNDESIKQLADLLVRGRYLAYPVLIVCGAGLAVLALGRMQRYCGDRRAQYWAMVSVAASLGWMGVAGWMGVVSYATQRGLQPGVSIAFSLAVIWLAASMLTLAVLVVREELRGERRARVKPPGAVRRV
jgi:hypothetical protein